VVSGASVVTSGAQTGEGEPQVGVGRVEGGGKLVGLSDELMSSLDTERAGAAPSRPR
jgi:hypothetical protein